MSEQSGKTRALRICLDYHKHRGALYWSRWVCALLAVMTAGSYGVFVLAGVFSSRLSNNPSNNGSSWLEHAALHVSTGPLAKVHAYFEDDCQKCHSTQGFQPIAVDAMRFNSKASLETHSAKCQACHSVRSHLPTSLANATCSEIDDNCAGCHQDHAGRDVDLAAVVSDKCTQCHLNLNEACGGAIPLNIEPKIERFAIEGHATRAGTFRSLASDPGRIKFSHAQHLNPGQVKSGRRGGFRSEMLPSKWSGKYTGNDDGLVQLQCGDCHRLQGTAGAPDDPGSFATASELAHFYAPIEFDEHCSACHQFTFAGQTDSMLPLPHAASKEDFETALSSKLIGGRLNGRLSMPKDLALDFENAIEKERQTLVNAEVETAVAHIYNGCGKCHLDDVADPVVYAQAIRADAEPMVPHRWLQHGLFEHGAHAQITNCGFCHQLSPNEEAIASEEVMIRGPESCVVCHRDPSDVYPQTQLAGESVDLRDARNRVKFLVGDSLEKNPPNQTDLASAECALCHRYHWSRQPASVASNDSAAKVVQ